MLPGTLVLRSMPLLSSHSSGLPVKTAITLTCSAEIRFPAMPHLLGPCPSILATCRLGMGGLRPPWSYAEANLSFLASSRALSTIW